MNRGHFVAGAAYLYCALSFLEHGGSSARMLVWALAAFFVAAVLFISAVFPKGLS
jgi:hypothetical protein